MTAPDLRSEPFPPNTNLGGVAPARVLALALLHLLDRDEPLPARWRADVFATSVAANRADLASAGAIAELDALARSSAGSTFRGAVTALASDPFAVALAVRRLELMRGTDLPAWPVIVRHGVAPRVSHAEQGRWFG